MKIRYTAFSKYNLMQLLLTVLILIVAVSACNLNNDKKQEAPLLDENIEAIPTVEVQKSTIEHRFGTPLGYTRISVDSSSFAYYLRSLPLKDITSQVRYYNGDYKTSHGVYVSVVDLPIGDKNLHQCADAIMRLRAEYLWRSGHYDDIHFNFTNGHKVAYRKWMDGNRMLINGNKTEWTKSASPSNTYDDFWSYMELIFMYAGTASLEKELVSVDIDDMKIGDIFIKGGYPGHAVVVVDMSVNIESGKKAYMLAQSYMPAQELQILSNPTNGTISPWYILESGQVLTPEWDFSSSDLMRFQ